MADILGLIWGAITEFFRLRIDREAEIVVLRHQLSVLRRKRPRRLVFTNTDRLLLAALYRLAPGILKALAIVEPETVIARQPTEAFGWGRAPDDIVRDLDGAYGGIFRLRLRAMGIRDRPIAPRSPGGTDTVSASSARSDGNVQTVLSSLASDIFGMYWVITAATTMRSEPIRHLARMLPPVAMQRSMAAFTQSLRLVDSIANTSGFDLR